MSRKLTPYEKELYLRTGEVLHYVWDPIGVSGDPATRDEYDSYLPQVFAMLLEGKGRDQIAAHLVHIEEERIGLAPKLQHAETVVELLLSWTSALRSKYSESL
jgi:hypothetical protein